MFSGDGTEGKEESVAVVCVPVLREVFSSEEGFEGCKVSVEVVSGIIYSEDGELGTKNIGTDSEIVKRGESETGLVFGRAEPDVITVSGIEFEIVISGSWEGTLLDKVILE